MSNNIPTDQDAADRAAFDKNRNAEIVRLRAENTHLSSHVRDAAIDCTHLRADKAMLHDAILAKDAEIACLRADKAMLVETLENTLSGLDAEFGQYVTDVNFPFVRAAIARATEGK